MSRPIDIIRSVFDGELLEQVPLARHTSLKVGGPADIFAIPRDIADLRNLVKILDELQIPRFVIGGGYNLLVRDGGFRGAAISLCKIQQMTVSKDGEVRAEAGVSTIGLARLAQAHGLSGLEFLIGIPGSIGGALRMNAGAHGGEIFDHLVSLELLDEDGVHTYDKKTFKYGYRCLQLEPNKIIIAAKFQLAAGSQEDICAEMDACLQKRRETQQVRFPNAGSFFRNPAGQAAWRLIDEAGLRGLTVGGAQVSEVHTNFLINRGGAQAADFLRLADIIKERVFNTSGVKLEEEVRITGED
ncbi:MAG: UDP-N-acetylmuramate dehydrogenase [Desulfuromonadales bacterium]|nr:UDP-N-acetylmuramate dehydrogenase [Desulfuromonadales bacterium]